MAKGLIVVDVTRMMPDVAARFANGTENCAFCTVLFALSSTMIRFSGKPRSISMLRICPASVLPFCGLPPVTMIGDCGKNCATIRPVSTRRRRIARIVPSGLRPYPRMTIAGFEKSFDAGRGLSLRTAGRHPPKRRRDGEHYCTGSGFPSASHASSATVGTNKVMLPPTLSLQHVRTLRNPILHQPHRSVAAGPQVRQRWSSQGRIVPHNEGLSDEVCVWPPIRRVSVALHRSNRRGARVKIENLRLPSPPQRSRFGSGCGYRGAGICGQQHQAVWVCRRR